MVTPAARNASPTPIVAPHRPVPTALNPYAYFKPATIARIGVGEYFMAGELDGSTVANIRLKNGTFTIEQRIFAPNGATPLVPPPRPMTTYQMKGIRLALQKYIDSTPGRQPRHVYLRDQLDKQIANQRS